MNLCLLKLDFTQEARTKLMHTCPVTFFGILLISMFKENNSTILLYYLIAKT